MAAAKLGLVGLGNLGMEFGLRAVAASRSVVAHDASPQLALAGAARAGSVGAVVAAAPTVVSVVPDDAAARAVADELLAAAAGRGSDAPPLLHLCGNFLIAASIEALGESLALAEGHGVDREAVLAMLASTIFDCAIYRGYGGRVAGRDHAPGGFALHHGLKDVGLVQKAAQDARACPCPSGPSSWTTCIE
ncbi:3-hydroxyisobutyrate dehydrogenase [Aureococcus anophagefferens]|uniref:3-hydroxyisobutyrate dehydrogenase n=1 Tax=Aureococcus anophagefferens TaxID=44056 RepID=A0ABR1G9N4_AURAN